MDRNGRGIASLTIGIPTFNRKESVCALLAELIDRGIDRRESVEVVVTDNASSDGTYDCLKAMTEGTRIKLSRNETNIGYCGNFLSLFALATKDYLLVLSDEDSMVDRNLDALMTLLSELEPDFVSTQYYETQSETTLYRGSKTTCVISGREALDCANFVSGTVYNVRLAREGFEKHKAYFAAQMGLYYPQILLALILIATGRGYWWNRPICGRTWKLKSSILGYKSVSARWEQHVELVDFLEVLRSEGCDPAFINEIRLSAESRFVKSFFMAIRIQRPDLLAGIKRAMVEYSIGRLSVPELARLRWDRRRQRDQS